MKTPQVHSAIDTRMPGYPAIPYHSEAEAQAIADANNNSELQEPANKRWNYTPYTSGTIWYVMVTDEFGHDLGPL